MKIGMNAPINGWRLISRLHVSGSQALALSTVATNLVRIISTVCLTRLLSPEVYGITGMIVSIFYVITMLTDVGFQDYIVRHPRGHEPDFLDAVWTIHASRGLLLTLIAALLAWPLSLILGKAQLVAPLAVSSLIFAIDGQASLNQFAALREGRVQRFALMDLAVSICQVLSAIVLAFFLRNVWAIIASMLLGSAARVWASYTFFPSERRSFAANRDVAADLWRFSRMIAVSSALTLVISQVDKLALGRILPLSQFGTYVIASALAAAPTAFAYNYSFGIVYPAVAAAVRDGVSATSSYYRCWGRFFYLYAFAGGGLVGGADLMVRLLYDPRYAAAATYLEILAIGTAMTMSAQSMRQALIAMGRAGLTVETNLVRLAWLTTGSLFALLRNDPILFVLTIGLLEVPAYVQAAWRMWQLGLIDWARELSFFAVLGSGICTGAAVGYIGRSILGN